MFEENEISVNANGGTEIAHRRLTELLPQELQSHFQIVSSRIRKLHDDKIRIYWAHDLPNDPEAAQLKDENYRKKFHKLVFISDYQYELFRNVLGVPYSNHSTVIETGIDPVEVNLGTKPKEPIRCVYTSTPQRGLHILQAVFEKLAETHKDIHLDVFSSFQLYGWKDQDEKFEPVFEKIRNHPQMTYHDVVPNKELKEFLSTANIFAYPCIWPETSCRALIEAMSAGLVCVHPNFAALPLTSGGLNLMYGGDQDQNKHASLFAHALTQAFDMIRNQDEVFTNRLHFIKHYVDTRFHIDKIRFQWQALLEDMLKQFPDVTKRKSPERMFSYRTVQQ